MKAGVVVPAAADGELGGDARRALAETSRDPDVLAALAVDENLYVRRHVAGHPNTPAAALGLLAGDEDTWVRRSVARNPNTSAATLTRLARNGDTEVRWHVAANPNTPAATLEVLAGDWSSGTRTRVAENRSTPIPVVVALMGDTAANVARFARRRFASWAQETLDLGSAPTEQLLYTLITLKAWELDPKDPAVVAAVVLCN